MSIFKHVKARYLHPQTTHPKQRYQNKNSVSIIVAGLHHSPSYSQMVKFIFQMGKPNLCLLEVTEVPGSKLSVTPFAQRDCRWLMSHPQCLAGHFSWHWQLSVPHKCSEQNLWIPAGQGTQPDPRDTQFLAHYRVLMASLLKRDFMLHFSCFVPRGQTE